MVYTVLMGLFPELLILCEVGGWIDGWMDGWRDGEMDRWMESQPISTGRKAIQGTLSGLRTSTKMPLCMTQLLRAFTGDQIVGYFS